jgi:hypothetical protein
MNSHEIKAAILNPFRPGNGLQKNYPDKQSLVGAVVVACKSGEKFTGGSGKWRFLISSRLLGASFVYDDWKFYAATWKLLESGGGNRKQKFHQNSEPI